MTRTVQVQCPAKINLFLEITGKKKNGYHTLASLFAKVGVFDVIDAEITEGRDFDFEIKNETDQTLKAGPDNLVCKAAAAFRKKFDVGVGVRIVLTKRIPMGAGLGGGSSDAAGTLIALARLFHMRLDRKLSAALKKMALELGADVPFFIRGGIQHGSGIGEVLEPVEMDFRDPVLLVIPPVQVSTKQAFEGLRLELTDQWAPVTFRRLLTKADVTQLFENHFEPSVFHTYPQISKIKADLFDRDAWFASLSGSGSTVYGVFEDRKLAEAAQSFFQRQGNTAVLTEPVG